MIKFLNEIEKNDSFEILNSKCINWDFYKNSSILITGATGMIAFQIITALLLANEKYDLNITIYALARNKEKTIKKFADKITPNLHFIFQDITEKINCPAVDFIIHTANGTASKGFVENPVETIDTIVIGTKNILEFAKDKAVKSVIYLSSMEVYGNISTERVEPLKESDYGYMDLMKVRNSYPLGKRLAENMCCAYFSQYDVPVKIARLSQIIGSGVDYNDNRVFAQFARNIVENKDIILKTPGLTVRSYCYVTDCVIALLLMSEIGHNGEVYNIANPDTTCSIREMAEMLCKKYPSSNLKINVDDRLYPDTTKYYLDTTKYYLDTTKYHLDTASTPSVSLEDMYSRLIENFKK